MLSHHPLNYRERHLLSQHRADEPPACEHLHPKQSPISPITCQSFNTQVPAFFSFSIPAEHTRMSFRNNLSPAASMGIAPQRGPVFAQSSLSPDSVHFSGMKFPPRAFAPAKKEATGLDPTMRFPPSSPAAAVGVQNSSPYKTSGFFIHERGKPRANEVDELAENVNPKFVPPALQRLGHQDEARMQKGKQFSPSSARSHPSIVSSHRSPRHGQPGLVPHQVTSAQPKLPHRAEPSHKHTAPSFRGPARAPDQVRISDHSSPVPLGDLDHSMKGSPLLFTHHPNVRPGERQANRPMVPEPAVDPRSAAPLRPNSRESNISKRRVNSSRLSFPFHGDEMADLDHFGSAWNNYLQNHARRTENVAARMRELEKVLEDKAKIIKENTHKCNQQSEVIAGLEKQVSDLTSQKQQLSKDHMTAQKQLERSEARRDEMQTKMRSYRDKLNEAITEQQDLYKRSKHLCDTAISDVRRTQEQAEATQKTATEMLEEGAQRATEARREMKILLEGELRECQILRNTGMPHVPSSFLGPLMRHS